MSYQGWSDFRSDTVTRPTAAMRRAMAEAEVGDDVLGDDPTVKELETEAASLVGKEAALFMPSGVMANTAALLAHGVRCQEVLVEEFCHILLYEEGNIASVAGAVPRIYPSHRGLPDESELDSRFNPKPGGHQIPTAGICLENSHNYHGGTVIDVAGMERMGRYARERELFLHLDGARLFHAAAALGVSARDLAAPVDSLMFCLSKGLSAPVGSMLCGSRVFIGSARHYRRVLGGALRQVGVLAAAGRVALQHMVARLPEDIVRARRLATGVAAIPGLTIDPRGVDSNIVIVTVREPAGSVREIVSGLAAERVLALPFGFGRIRFVTHADIDDADIDRAVAALRRASKRG